MVRIGKKNIDHLTIWGFGSDIYFVRGQYSITSGLIIPNEIDMIGIDVTI